MKITKSNIESYKLKGDNFAWAEIGLSVTENGGRVSISSDFGNWAYYWGACGCSFKEFLINLDIHYAAGKFGEDQWFDLDKTLESLRERIKCYSGDQEYKSKLFIEYHELKRNAHGKEEFMHCIQCLETIMDFEGYCPEMETDISPSFKQFWEKLWKPFVEHLKEESDKEYKLDNGFICVGKMEIVYQDKNAVWFEMKDKSSKTLMEDLELAKNFIKMNHGIQDAFVKFGKINGKGYSIMAVKEGGNNE